MNQTSTTRNDSRPVSPSATQLVPLSLTQARLGSSGFWGTRSRINAENTLEHCLGWQERAGWLPNFDLAASGKLPAGRQGREFSDSEIYKLLEGYCWESETHPSDDIEACDNTLLIAERCDVKFDTSTSYMEPAPEPRPGPTRMPLRFDQLMKSATTRK